MTLPLAIAEKLQLLANGEQLPGSRLKHRIVDEMIEEGIISVRMMGRTKQTLYIPDISALNNYLYNQFSISDLNGYITALANDAAGRAELVMAANDSKAVARRTFKGFLVNCYAPLPAVLNGRPYIVSPDQGTFQFIYNFEHFVPAEDIIIAGIENAENFALVHKMRYLFGDAKMLFVSRYPQEQSKDLIKWLQSIPNAYWHLGDYDIAGINIYMQEYKKYLGQRATFFITPDIEQLIDEFGNRSLYDQQSLNNEELIDEPGLHGLIALIHMFKKGLEQEILLR